MEGITDADYPYTKKVCKSFKIRRLGDYHDLYAQCHTLLLADVFKNFRNMCLEIYELNIAHFFRTRITMASSLKKDQSKIRSIN